MTVYLYQRFLGLLIVLLGVSAVTFAMIHMVPGDPVMLLLGDQATADDIARLRSQLGLDRPLPEQYVRYLGRALTGDLGRSLRSGQPVLHEIAARFPPTLALTLTSIAVATVFGVAIGVGIALTRNRVLELLLSALPLVGLSMPTFWSGLLLISLFALTLGWVPVVGGTGWRSLVLPTIALSLPTTALVARMTRAQLLDALGQDFVRTAEAKGLPRRTVVFKHALIAALIPVVTVVSLQFGALLGGAIVIESVFARPGLGRLAVEAILARDFPLVQGVVLVSAVAYVFVNVAAELVYTAIDPRIVRS